MAAMEQTLGDERKKLDHDRDKLMKRDNIVVYNIPEKFELSHWTHQQKEDLEFVKELF